MKEAKDADFPDELRVVVYNPDSENLSETLGITDDRLNSLQDTAKDLWNKSDSLGESMVSVSMAVRNANELAYLMFAIGHMRERQKVIVEKLTKNSQEKH